MKRLEDHTVEELRQIRPHVGERMREQIERLIREKKRARGEREDPDEPVLLSLSWKLLESKNTGSGETQKEKDQRWARKLADCRTELGKQCPTPQPRYVHDVYAIFWVYRPNRSWDAPNFVDFLCDTLEGAVIANDRKIARLTVHRRLDRQRPRVEIEVGPVP